MSKQRFAKQANAWIQQMMQITSQVYFDQQICAQKQLQLANKQALFSESLNALHQRKLDSSQQLFELHQIIQDLRKNFQKQFGPEPTLPKEISTETSLLS